MVKEWFILINGIQEGPYSIKDLKRHSQLTPDTLVRKRGWKDWVAIRHVLELKDVFKDEPSPQLLNGKKSAPGDLTSDQAALTISQQDPFHPYLWILLIVSFLIYLIYLISE